MVSGCMTIAGSTGDQSDAAAPAIFWPTSGLHAISAGRVTGSEGLVERAGVLCGSSPLPLSHRMGEG